MTFTQSEFRPRFDGGHVQTLYAWAKPRVFPRLPAPVARYFDVAPDARVLAHCHWHDRPAEHPTLILLHGLEGSSLAHYMGGMADKAWARGWNVVRLNQRNCGDTEHLSRGLYHSGLTHDPLFVMRELIARDGIRAIAVAGYSLGGNLTLKLAGDLGDAAPAGAQGGVRGVTDDGSGGVRAGAGAPVERRLSVEFRPPAQGADATQGCRRSRGLLARTAATHLDGPPVRRGLHRAPPRLP